MKNHQKINWTRLLLGTSLAALIGHVLFFPAVAAEETNQSDGKEKRLGVIKANTWREGAEISNTSELTEAETSYLNALMPIAEKRANFTSSSNGKATVIHMFDPAKLGQRYLTYKKRVLIYTRFEKAEPDTVPPSIAHSTARDLLLRDALSARSSLVKMVGIEEVARLETAILPEGASMLQEHHRRIGAASTQKKSPGD